MAQRPPLISVYMPTRNRCNLLLRAINSVLNQSYRRFELLVVDDASTDDTWACLEQQAAGDSRLRIFRQTVQSGACRARNRAITAARGELITNIDDDDEFLPDRLAQMQQAMDSRYSGVATGYQWNYGHKTTTLFGSRQVVDLPTLLDQNVLSFMMTRTQHLQDIGGFDSELAACHDYDVWIRLVHRFGPALRIAPPSYRVHTGHDHARISTSGLQLQVQAHQGLVDKHRHLMSERNLANQLFYQLTAARKIVSPFELLRSLRYGLWQWKCRYAASRWLSGVARLRARYVRGGLSGLLRR